MQTSRTHDGAPPAPDGKIVLRVNVLDTSPIIGRLSRAEQAELFCLARPHYAELRAGRKSPSIRTAMRIAAKSGLPVEVLFGVAA